MKTVNRDTCREIRAQLDDFLKELGKEHGMSFEIGTIRFDSSSMRMTVTSNIVGNAEKPETRIDLKVGQKIKVKKTIYTIQEIDNSRPKFCVSVTTDRGAAWRVTKEFLMTGVLLSR